MGVIIINSYAFGGVAPISDIYSKDDAGNGASGGGNSRFTKTIGGSPQHDQVLANPMAVSAGQAITVGLNGNWTSTETSIAWSVITVDNGMGVVSGVSPTSGTSAGFDPIFTISGGASFGQQSIYTLRLAVTNSNGTVTKDWNFIVAAM